MLIPTNGYIGLSGKINNPEITDKPDKNFNNLEPHYVGYSKRKNYEDEITGGGLTLFEKSAMTGPFKDKAHYDQYIPMHYIFQVLNMKLSKSNPGYDDRLFFLVAETGSGKTTALIVNLYRFFNTPNSPYTNQNYFTTIDSVSDFDFPNTNPRNESTPKVNTSHKFKKIIVTQPKVTTAITKAKELSSDEKYYPGIVMGKNIGYKTGKDKLIPKDENGLIFATLGSLTAELMASKDEKVMEKYSFIIIDECHERSMELDFAVYMLKEFLTRNSGNPNLPMVILMSATFDYHKYIKYFGSNPNNYLFVKGSSAKYDVFYSEYDVEDIYIETYKILETKVYNQELSTDNKLFTKEELDANCLDILIFLPGGGELKKMQKFLEKQPLTKDEIYQLISSETFASEGLGYLEYSFEESKTKSGKSNATRRIILSTSVVETGLTIPTLKWVIDIAFQRTPEFNPVGDFSCLLTKPASKSSIIQRRGRTGRYYPGGVVHCLYKKEIFDMLPEYNLPDIYIADSSDFFLKLLNINIKNPQMVFDKLDNAGFINFINECVYPDLSNATSTDSKGPKIPLNNRGIDKYTEKSNCLNMYNLGSIRTLVNKLTKLNNINADKLSELEINFKIHPPEMLDNYADVSVISYLQKIKSLGFLGTYLGYVASSIQGLSLEAKRLVMLSYTWKISFNDMLIIATFASNKRKDYIQSSQGKNVKFRYYGSDVYKAILKFYPKFGKVYSPQELESLVCDEFIEALVIYTLYKKYISEFASKGLSYVEGPMNKLGILFKGFIEILNTSFDLRNDFKKFGFEEHFEPINLFDNPKTFLDKVSAIKKCIESAYKNNILMYDGTNYLTQKGIKVTVPFKFGIKSRPRKVAYSSLFMINSPDSIIYECTADKLSVLDGYC